MSEHETGDPNAPLPQPASEYDLAPDDLRNINQMLCKWLTTAERGHRYWQMIRIGIDATRPSSGVAGDPELTLSFYMDPAGAVDETKPCRLVAADAERLGQVLRAAVRAARQGERSGAIRLTQPRPNPTDDGKVEISIST